MPKISRNGDMCRTGHACTSAAPVKATQFTVFANGKPIARKGDPIKPHTILVPGPPPLCVGHKAKVRRGSRQVFIKGIGVARRGDSADKGSMKGASFNVTAG
tara:strand:+ start:325 stop:630 length:306 start_codon:yes stop_codon:yes gene_type:complete